MKATLLAAAFAGTAGGCGIIWGFEDPVALRDGGPGAAQGACACVPTPSDPWEGPFELFEGSGSPPAPFPSCSGAYPTVKFDGFASPSTAPATCTCACGPPSNVCSPPVATLYKDGNCMRPCGAPDVTIGPACTSLDSNGCVSMNGGAHVTLSPSDASDGGCTPETTVGVGPAPWTRSARLCGPATSPTALTPPSPAACATGQVCAAAIGDAFEAATYCVVRPGTWACPTATYTVARTYYAAANDTRKCTCTCDSPTGVSCNKAKLSTYTDMGCTMPTGPTPAPSGCISAASAIFSAAPGAGSCTPRGGQDGDFVPTAPSTICCTP